MKWAKSLLFLVTLIVAPGAIMAQTGRITGTVTDSASGQPILSATVTVVGTKLAAATTSDGRYSIANIPAGTVRVRVQRLGFAARTRAITIASGDNQTVNFALGVQAAQLEAVVSIGYGTQNMRDVTGAVSAVTTEAL